ALGRAPDQFLDLAWREARRDSLEQSTAALVNGARMDARSPHPRPQDEAGQIDDEALVGIEPGVAKTRTVFRHAGGADRRQVRHLLIRQPGLKRPPRVVGHTVLAARDVRDDQDRDLEVSRLDRTLPLE